MLTGRHVLVSDERRDNVAHYTISSSLQHLSSVPGLGWTLMATLSSWLSVVRNFTTQGISSNQRMSKKAPPRCGQLNEREHVVNELQLTIGGVIAPRYCTGDEW